MKSKSLFVLAALAILALPSAAAQAAAPQLCGPFLGGFCGPDHFCDHHVGTCGLIGATGHCARVPQVCPRILRPVCGCDGKTYANDCLRQAAMVSKAHNGRCRLVPQ
ncbi:Kazal-type serine protease inhibitor family protein [Rhodopseudomonas palustris]|uniref:Kazal-type serine protease inhibitor family protein n=1 Tax=Rhodopseudomonas palustris TaxID=1076 RepID=UPI0020CF1C0F|nr:Kazal-type serine protease inhibitor family protein [Rhodopseudomonas palustris]MCP9625788.1 Kazal-type serine protease inhibitor family protein [Rhodopseudomonas palustris]